MTETEKRSQLSTRCLRNIARHLCVLLPEGQEPDNVLNFTGAAGVCIKRPRVPRGGPGSFVKPAQPPLPRGVGRVSLHRRLGRRAANLLI